MKKLFTLSTVFIFLGVAFLLVSPSFAKQKLNSKSNKGAVNETKKPLSLIESLSRTRVYIEFYYMETGEYPKNLKELFDDLNSLLPRNLKKVEIPNDPATGKSFVYKVASDFKSYTLTVPDPKAYKIPNLKFKNVPWGGFTLIVEQRKVSFLRRVCAENIKGLATAIEYYAKDHKKKVPKELKELIPKYIKTIPMCPVMEKPYAYKSDGVDYTISCPNPKGHHMRNLMFSSKQGWITK